MSDTLFTAYGFPFNASAFASVQAYVSAAWCTINRVPRGLCLVVTGMHVQCGVPSIRSKSPLTTRSCCLA